MSVQHHRHINKNGSIQFPLSIKTQISFHPWRQLIELQKGHLVCHHHCLLLIELINKCINVQVTNTFFIPSVQHLSFLCDINLMFNQLVLFVWSNKANNMALTIYLCSWFANYCLPEVSMTVQHNMNFDSDPIQFHFWHLSCFVHWLCFPCGETWKNKKSLQIINEVSNSIHSSQIMHGILWTFSSDCHCQSICCL